MPKPASSRNHQAKSVPAVDVVCLDWGRDRLYIWEPSWCQAIQSEVLSPPADINWVWDRYTRSEAERVHMGFGSSESIQRLPKGVVQLTQPPVAARCLREFLGLELPAAVILGGMGSQMRFIALRARLTELTMFSSPSWLYVNLVFDGLQLYADGRIGDPIHEQVVDDFDSLQRRTLDNKWCNVSFDCDTRTVEPMGRWNRSPKRDFTVREGCLLDEEFNVLRRVSL